MGIALLPTFIVGDAVRVGALQAIDMGLQAAAESIYVAHPEGRRALAKLRALVQCIRDAFGTPPY